MVAACRGAPTQPARPAWHSRWQVAKGKGAEQGRPGAGQARPCSCRSLINKLLSRHAYLCTRLFLLHGGAGPGSRKSSGPGQPSHDAVDSFGWCVLTGPDTGKLM